MSIDIPSAVKKAVVQMEPCAEIYLYGSRARHDNRPESDWDFLVLVDGPVDSARTDRIRHRLYEIEWESGEVISAIVKDRDEWNSGKYAVVPFRRAIARDGVAV